MPWIVRQLVAAIRLAFARVFPNAKRLPWLSQKSNFKRENPFMPINWTPFVDLVQRHQRFLITTHVRPDPDGLGSVLALAAALGQMGKEVRLVISSVWPRRYDFLDEDRRVQRFESPGTEFRDAEVIIILDTGTWGQLGDFGFSQIH